MGDNLTNIFVAIIGLIGSVVIAVLARRTKDNNKTEAEPEELTPPPVSEAAKSMSETIASTLIEDHRKRSDRLEIALSEEQAKRMDDYNRHYKELMNSLVENAKLKERLDDALEDIAALKEQINPPEGGTTQEHRGTDD